MHDCVILEFKRDVGKGKDSLRNGVVDWSTN